jgi:hypothetical protein
MKKYLLPLNIILSLLLFTNLVFAEVTLQFFTAKPNSSGILIEWKTINESGTVRFELERSVGMPDNFTNVFSADATGNNSYYQYQDNATSRLVPAGGSGNSPASNEVYYYRLKCINSQGGYVYTNHITVTQSVSGIRRTWGSIKAIFR